MLFQVGRLDYVKEGRIRYDKWARLRCQILTYRVTNSTPLAASRKTTRIILPSMAGNRYNVYEDVIDPAINSTRLYGTGDGRRRLRLESSHDTAAATDLAVFDSTRNEKGFEISFRETGCEFESHALRFVKPVKNRGLKQIKY